MENFNTLGEVQTWADDHTGGEIVSYFNALPGVQPVKRFEDRKVAAKRIWSALGHPALATAKPDPLPLKVNRQRGAKPKAKKAARKATKKAAPDGRVDQVVALLKRKGGAPLTEIMKA